MSLLSLCLSLCLSVYALAQDAIDEARSTDSMLARAERGARARLLQARSLSLTIWGAKLSAQNRDERDWDLRSPPDGLARVYLAGRLLRQSGVQRDNLQPFWALTIGPLDEQRFFEGPLVVQIVDQDILGEEVIEELSITLPTYDQLGEIQQAHGTGVETLIYQWVAISPQDSAPPRSSINLGAEFPRSEVSTRPLGGSTRQDTGDGSDLSVRSTRRRNQAARRASNAAQLYRAYLRAQFEGDRLQERALLLRLAHRYSETRHGRKAQRILLLDGR